jgi:hypothetical protein
MTTKLAVVREQQLAVRAFQALWSLTLLLMLCRLVLLLL